MPQSGAAANPWLQEEEKKMSIINACKIDKQMHEMHIDQLPLSQN